ncbi:nitroreductase family protein [Streptomyces olivaceus]|uniref:nitroreductase family protein n=1 Tax=Streptomyces olivaceus TaxID=47716 RepID=UPI0040563893
MDVMTAVMSRRSARTLIEPAPSDEEFGYLLRAAATAPDHGRIRPWRWVLVRGEGRTALGRCFADGSPAPATQRYRTESKAHRAPLLATLVFTPAAGHRVPEWEQLAATSAMTSSLMLLLHARGFGSIWRTGKFTESADVGSLLGLSGDERLLGWLYIGTAEGPQPVRRRLPDDVSDRVSVFTPEPALA